MALNAWATRSRLPLDIMLDAARGRAARVTLVASGVIVGTALAPVTVSAAIKYFSATRTVSGYGSAYCPGGTKLVGGGVQTLPSNYYGSTSSREYQLTGSYPSGNTWRASAVETDGSYSSSSGWHFNSHSYTPQVSAICVS
jgi:hypothetical protein